MREFLIIIVIVLYTEAAVMRKRAIPPSKRENRLMRGFYGRLLGLTRSICGKPQRMAALWPLSGASLARNLGGNTDLFVPYRRKGLFYFHTAKQKGDKNEMDRIE